MFSTLKCGSHCCSIEKTPELQIEPPTRSIFGCDGTTHRAFLLILTQSMSIAPKDGEPVPGIAGALH